MRIRKHSSLLLVLVAVVSLGACKKKPDAATGTTEGIQPGEDRGAERVEKPATPVTPPLVEGDLNESGIGGPLKDIYFDFDRYEIRPDQRPTIEANGRWLVSNGDSRVLVEGHCDERGTEEYNLALGDRRANAAKVYLISLGVQPGRIDTISYGKAYPVDPGHSEEAWARNRRAHFTVKPGR